MYPMCTLGFFSLLRSLRPWLSLARLQLDVPSLATFDNPSRVVIAQSSAANTRLVIRGGIVVMDIYHFLFACLWVGMCILYLQNHKLYWSSRIKHRLKCVIHF